MRAAEAKIKRVRTALEGREPDRVPIGEFFWTNFIRRCKRELNVGDAFDAYRHWDLDLIVITPNMDPQLRGVQVLENTPERKLVRTGFGATIERKRDFPVPHYVKFETESFEQMEALVFDDPRDPRRYYTQLEDQINSVADELNMGYPSFADRVKAYVDDFCVFGSICEPHEMIWRICGTENVLYKLAEDPERTGKFIARLGDFLVGITEAQIQAAGGRLSGIYIWGDIAYRQGMFFSPALWRRLYQPQLARICAVAHAAGLKTIYHGCGNATPVYEDLRAAGVDAYNPLEAKAGLDVVDLKRRFGSRWAFNGNINMQVLERNNLEEVRREVLRKLNAAKGGGYILQSDHSVSSDVAPATYDYVVKLAREYGRYPLKLGEFDEAM